MFSCSFALKSLAMRTSPSVARRRMVVPISWYSLFIASYSVFFYLGAAVCSYVCWSSGGVYFYPNYFMVFMGGVLYYFGFVVQVVGN